MTADVGRKRGDEDAIRTECTSSSRDATVILVQLQNHEYEDEINEWEVREREREVRFDDIMWV